MIRQGEGEGCNQCFVRGGEGDKTGRILGYAKTCLPKQCVTNI